MWDLHPQNDRKLKKRHESPNLFKFLKKLKKKKKEKTPRMLVLNYFQPFNSVFLVHSPFTE